MIDIITYRRRIGCFNPCKCNRSKKFKQKLGGYVFGLDFFKSSTRARLKLLFKFYSTDPTVSLRLAYLVCIYFIMFFIFTSLNIVLNMKAQTLPEVLPSFISNYNWFGLPNLSIIHVRLAYFVCISLFLNNLFTGHGPVGKIKRLTPATIFFGQKTSRVKQMTAILLIFILLLTFLMIAITNTSVINPGPQNLKIYYQNVQGLVPFSSLVV